MDFSGRLLLEGFRIQLLLAQHWIHVYVSLRRLLENFLLREGGLGPCLSLCNDKCPWSLCRARRRQWYGWFCWLRCTSRCVGISRCVSPDGRRPKDLAVVAISQVHFLHKVIVFFTVAVVQTMQLPLLQLIFKDVHFPVVA